MPGCGARSWRRLVVRLAGLIKLQQLPVSFRDIRLPGSLRHVGPRVFGWYGPVGVCRESS